jgi:hypothetical protein
MGWVSASEYAHAQPDPNAGSFREPEQVGGALLHGGGASTGTGSAVPAQVRQDQAVAARQQFVDPTKFWFS